MENYEVKSQREKKPFCLRVDKEVPESPLGFEQFGKPKQSQKPEYFQKPWDFGESKDHCEIRVALRNPVQRETPKEVQKKPAEDVVPEYFGLFDNESVLSVIKSHEEVHKKVQDE